MAQLMAALVGVLNENLTESIKAFYKLRKAYLALDGILRMEGNHFNIEAVQQGAILSSVTRETPSLRDGSWKPSSSETSGHSTLGFLDTDALPSPKQDESNIHSTRGSGDQSQGRISAHSSPSDADIPSNSVDQFIHSGTNLCFGLLLLLLSLVPPAFNKLLYIAGFKGNRPKGLRMLWQASKVHTLTGAIAAFALLAFYNGFVRCCDILPDASPEHEEDIEGYPMQRLSELLSDMRGRFPQSRLWLLEESRMEGAQQRLENALRLLSTPVKSSLKQVEALCVFEKSLNAMYLHKYELCAESFLKVCQKNPVLPFPLPRY